jgi:NADH:ubiquinone oxidoreductase subunit D
MDDIERHGEIMGALGRIDEKVDNHHEEIKSIQKRHEKELESLAEDVDSLEGFRERTKGVALAVTLGTAVMAGMTAIIARAKGMF